MSGAGTLQDHTAPGCRIVRHDSRWSACPPCAAWIDTHSPRDAAALIRATPALLNEARGWIRDSFEGVTAHTLDSHGITALVSRNYAGGCPEFVRNSAPLIPAPEDGGVLVFAPGTLTLGDLEAHQAQYNEPAAGAPME